MSAATVAFCAMAFGGNAYAQSADSVPGISSTAPGITPEGALAPVSIVEGPGIKVGEGTVIHPIVGMEAGWISNVFFADQDTHGAGILRFIAQVGVGSLSPQRLSMADRETSAGENHGVLEYRADLRLTYDQYLSGRDAIQEQGGLGVGASLRGTVLPGRTWSLRYLENFDRLIRPTNFETSSSTNRDINHLQLGLAFAPGGGAITGLLHYENVIDRFEDDDQKFASRIQHTFGLTGTWRFRPLTVFFADASIGVFGGLGDASVKSSSYPLTLQTGAQTLLSLKTTVIARIGYTNGFYSEGPSYSSILGGLQLGYRYTPSGRVTALYEYVHQDSINANYYRDHHIGLTVEQQFAPFVMTGGADLYFRKYDGVSSVAPGSADTRDDVIFSASAGARYNFRDWIAGVVQYRFSTVQTDFVTGAAIGGDDPSFVRHEVVLGVRAAL